ncbi:MAG: hypothetical protein WBD31_02610 [Rubripirellula sp.]
MKNTIKSLAVASFIVVSLSTNLALAAVVTYSESLDGDLAPSPSANPDVTEPLTVFNFDRGINTISGTMTYRRFAPSDPFDVDSFAFTIPSNTRLDFVSIDTILREGSPSAVAWAVNEGHEFNNGALEPEYLGAISAPIPGNSGDRYTTGLFPLAAGDYNFSFNNGVIEPGSNARFHVFDYTASFDVVAVPEPSVSIFLVACATIFLSRRSAFSRKPQTS